MRWLSRIVEGARRAVWAGFPAKPIPLNLARFGPIWLNQHELTEIRKFSSGPSTPIATMSKTNQGIDMNSTNITPEQREKLLSHAKLVDLIDSGGFGKFSTLTTEADRLFETLKRARMHARWLLAIRKHGSPAQAVEAAQRGRDEARRQREQLLDAASEIRQARDALLVSLGGDRLAGLFEQLGNVEAIAMAANSMQDMRNAKVASLIEDGVPEATALSIAKPSLAEIKAKEDEAKAIPGKVSELKAATISSVTKVNYLYPLPPIK